MQSCVTSKKYKVVSLNLAHRVYAIARMLSPVRLSVRPYVRRVYRRKTVEVRIMKFSPYGSAIPLVFAG